MDHDIDMREVPDLEDGLEPDQLSNQGQDGDQDSDSVNESPQSQVLVTATIKSTKGDKEAVTLEPKLISFDKNNLQSFFNSLWVGFHSNIAEWAVLQDDKYIVSPSSPTVDDMDKFFILKAGNHHYKKEAPQNGAKHVKAITQMVLNGWAKDHEDGADPKKLDLIIMKHSTAVMLVANLTKFKKDALQPAAVDRAGAAAEEEQVGIIERLQQTHGSRIESLPIHWRRWAAWVHLETVPHLQDELIGKPPPVHLAPYFHPRNTTILTHFERLHQQTRINRRHVGNTLSENAAMRDALNTLKDMAKVMHEMVLDALNRLDAHDERIRAQEEMWGDFGSAMQANLDAAASPELMSMLDSMEPQNDVDHA
ncbi:hypothetical protein HDV05_007563 [Chytridiales sp. JEL 0842]|nr:hypothetical protein HDV05_007563 [Chytridiales sp. JEL 0842]